MIKAQWEVAAHGYCQFCPADKVYRTPDARYIGPAEILHITFVGADASIRACGHCLFKLEREFIHACKTSQLIKR